MQVWLAMEHCALLMASSRQDIYDGEHSALVQFAMEERADMERHTAQLGYFARDSVSDER
jgi:hypothetical protein